MFERETSYGITGEGVEVGVFFQKWDQTPNFGLKSLILVSFYF